MEPLTAIAFFVGLMIAALSTSDGKEKKPEKPKKTPEQNLVEAFVETWASMSSKSS